MLHDIELQDKKPRSPIDSQVCTSESNENERRLSAGQRPGSLTLDLLAQTAHSMHISTLSDLVSFGVQQNNIMEDTYEGLSADEAHSRLSRFGRNDIRSGPSQLRIWVGIFLRNVFNFMMVVLLVAMVLSLAIQEWIDAAALFLVITVNMLIGFVQEFHSERALQSLNKMSGSQQCVVVRDGVTDVAVPIGDLVVGDLVHVKEGDTVPADMRLLRDFDLECDEMLLTGESMPVQKDSSAILPKDAPLGDRINMLFRGTAVVKGSAHGIVTSTAMRTQIGAIAKSLSKTKKAQKPRLQRSLQRMGIVLILTSIICFSVVLLSVWLRGAVPVFPNGLKIGVSIAVAMIPEALMPVLTLNMTFAAKAMVKKNALVRKLSSIESLGHITNICSDKTGTMTEGNMSVTHVWVSGKILAVSNPNPNPGACSSNSTEERGSVFVDDSSKVPVPKPYAEAIRTLVSVCSLCNQASVKKKQNTGTVTSSDDSTKQSSEKKSSSKSKWSLRFWDRKKQSQNLDSDEGDDSAADWIASGNPTEIALAVLANRCHMPAKSLSEQYGTQCAEFSFDSNLKRMTTVYLSETQDTLTHHAFVKGAPERVLELCTRYMLDMDGTISVMNEEMEHTVHRVNDSMAEQGLRVLAIAYRSTTHHKEQPSSSSSSSSEQTDANSSSDSSRYKREEFEQSLVFVGLIGIRDPPRQEVPTAIRICQEAGIIVHMCTGDHLSTAVAIARQVGLFSNEEEDVIPSLVMLASQFDALTDEELQTMKRLPLVLARCSPQTKVKLIQELHRRKKYVAMTGDGVNDAPAIKGADVGISMGGGADVTKQASDIVLLDNNFASIVSAVQEGRMTFTSIRKFLVHFLTSNVAAVTVLLCSILAGLPMALNPTQILFWIVVTGTPCALALSKDRSERHSVMDKRYHKPDMPVFSWEMIIDMLAFGLWMGGLALGNVILMTIWDRPHQELQSIALSSITMGVLLHAYVCRDTRRPFFADDLYGAYPLHIALVFGIGALCFALFVPFVNSDLMKHAPLVQWIDWVLIFAASALYLAGTEVYKGIKRTTTRLTRFAHQMIKEHRSRIRGIEQV